MVTAGSISGKSISVDEGLAVLKRLEETVEELDSRAIREKGKMDASGTIPMEIICGKLQAQLENVIIAVRQLIGKNEGMFELLMERLAGLEKEIPVDDEIESDGFVDRTRSEYDCSLLRIIKYYNDSGDHDDELLECAKKLMARVYRDGIGHHQSYTYRNRGRTRGMYDLS
jgi:hypothetical protein